MGTARPVYALWNGGASYAPAELPQDLERFGSISQAADALRFRVGTFWAPDTFRYVERQAESVWCPAAGESGAGMTLWTYDPRGKDDPYPSLVLELGPRGGVRRVTT